MNAYRNDNTRPNHAQDYLRSQLTGDALGGPVEFQSPGETQYSYPDTVRGLADGDQHS